MWDQLLIVCIWGFAAFGVYSFLVRMIKGIEYRNTILNKNIRLFMYIDQDTDKIEGIIRGIDEAVKSTGIDEFCRSLVVLDATSEDEAHKIIQRLCTDNRELPVVLVDQNTKIKDLIKE